MAPGKTVAVVGDGAVGLLGVLSAKRIGRIWNGDDPDKVFNQTLPLEQVADDYRAMDERRAIKTLLMP